jgi:putative FmdB family regulatory protein
MPTYEYRCNACKHEFEEFQSMKDKSLTKCPSCGKKALERLIGTGAAIVFKGSGFWQTDYRSESYKKAAEADKPPEKNESKPDGKADSKPSDKPAEKTSEKPAEKAAEKPTQKKSAPTVEKKPAKSKKK